MIKKIINILRKYRQVCLTAVFLGICADILFFKESSDLRVFTILGIYIISIILFKLSGKFTFVLGLGILSIMYVQFLLTGTSENTEKAAVWLFFLIGIGLIQRLKE